MSSVPDLIERAEKALEGVTEGPWDFTFEDPEGFAVVFLNREKTIDLTISDLNFIDASRTLIPELVEALKRAEAALAEQREVINADRHAWNIAFRVERGATEKIDGVLKKVIAERDALKAEIEKERRIYVNETVKVCRRLESERDTLKAEIDRLTFLLNQRTTEGLRYIEERDTWKRRALEGSPPQSED